MNRVVKIALYVIGGVLFVIALLPLISGSGGHKKKDIKLVSGDEVRETQPRPTYKALEDVDDEEPTAYATKAVETEVETTVEETTEAPTMYEDGVDTNDTPESGSALTEENYQRVLINIIGGGALVHTNFRECFTDNYMAHLDEFNESNPLYKHIDMNSWEYGDYMSGECAIRIQDVGVYRYSYTIIDGKLDSITYEGEE